MRKPTPGPAWTIAVTAAFAIGGAVLCAPAHAVPATARQAKAARLSIASPATGNLVAGTIQIAIAYDGGAAGRITTIELWVDDLIAGSHTLEAAEPRGTHTIDWDTQQVRNGQHSLKVLAYVGHKAVAADSVVVSVSNGGVDVVPPLITFYAPLEGQIVTGNLNIGVNATDNDQVALVGLFVNRQLKMMKSHPPYQYTLDTTTLPLLNGRGALVLEAWAYDRAQNRGIARPITVYAQNRINATPMQPNPKPPKGGAGKQGTEPANRQPPGTPDASVPAPSSEPVVTKPEPKAIARLSPLEALAPSKSPAAVEAGPEPAPLKLPAPAPPSSAKPKPTVPEAKLTPAPETRVDIPLPPEPSPAGASTIPPPSGRPTRSTGVVEPKADARLDVTLRPSTPTGSIATSPDLKAPRRERLPRSVKPPLKPAPVTLEPLEMARLPADALIAVPQPSTRLLTPPSRRAARKPAGARATRSARPPVIRSARLLPKAIAPQPAAKPAKASRSRRPEGLQQGSTPDRIVLPVYRLARLPETPSKNRMYTVQRGDTLTRIARGHGVTPRSILVANGLEDGAALRTGRRLAIPGTITIAYNDQPIGFDVQPRVEGGMAITPFRQVFEHTGGIVRYNSTEREVEAKSPAKEVRLKIGSREALVNSAVVIMDRAAFLDSGRTMVPVKFMTEALDLKAEYDLKTGAIYLIKK